MKHLPNLLADQPLVREFIQDDMTPANPGQELLAMLEDARRVVDMVEQFSQTHAALRRNASQLAVRRVLQVAGWGAQHGQ